MLFGKKQAHKRETVIGLDLGSQQWKGVVIHRGAQGLQLNQYVVAPCPCAPGKAESQVPFVEAAQKMLTELKTHDRTVAVAISSLAGIVIRFEMPHTPPDELRAAISLNSTRYLRRSLSDYYFDAVELGDAAVDGRTRHTSTMQVLLAGAPKEEVLWYRDALSAAKIKARTIELSAVAAINALQRSHTEICEQNVVLALDIGHQLTRVVFLGRGQPLLARLIPFGGAQLTEQIALTLGLQPAEAEQQKRAMNKQTVEAVRGALQTLAREVRSSIDFIERQQDCEIRYAFAGGGIACSAAIVEALSEEVGLPIQRWNPSEGYNTAGLDAEALASLAPCLGPAVGVAVAQLPKTRSR